MQRLVDRAEVLRIVDEHREALGRLGVESIALFGSVARDEARPDSDIDLLVDVRRPMGAFQFLEIKEYLERLLGRRVDLVTRRALRPQLREQVLREAIVAGAEPPGP